MWCMMSAEEGRLLQVPNNRRKKKTKRSFPYVALFIIGTILFVTLSPTIVDARSNGKMVKLVGTEGVTINKLIFATFRFSPGTIHVHHGDMIVFTHMTTGHDPHTVSIVNTANLPTTIDEVFACGGPGTVCGAIFMAHGFGPNGPGPTFSPFVNVPGNPSGFEQNGKAGNSFFIIPGQSVEVTITSASGTTLHYLCALHPWMQGSIVVQNGSTGNSEE